MTTRLVGEERLGRSWSDEWQDAATSRSFTRVQLVEATSASDDEAAVLATSGVYLRGDTHPANSEAICRRRSVEERESNERTYWLYAVTCEFETDVPNSDEAKKDGKGEGGEPEDRPARWSFDSETIEVALREDPVDGDAIANSVGQLLPQTTVENIGIWQLERYLIGGPARIRQLQEAHLNTTNDAEWNGAAINHLLCSKIAGGPADIDDRPDLMLVQFEFKYRPKNPSGAILGWKFLLDNLGTQAREVENGPLRPIYLKPDGTVTFNQFEGTVQVERYLNEDGRLSGSQGTIRTQTGEFSRYPQSDFSLLPL